MAEAAHFVGSMGPLQVGDQFLKFEIRGLLGHGGHGWVYHGYDSFLDRHVAIKVIPSPAGRGRDLQRRAQLEARVLCKLQHPNVVRVIDAGASSAGAVYIVMEILHGRTLREVLHAVGPLNVCEMLSLGAQIADGVQAAHEQSAIHRDLKPENVFVLHGNTVKVLDFGIAKFLGPGAATTQKDLLHGTLIYMSPEHLQGLRVTARSDIYALGTLLYEAIAGRPPCLLGMEEPTLESLSFAQINRMPPPLDELTPDVPRFVARSVQRMLAKAPVDRFATMAEVGSVLRANAQRLLNEAPQRAGSHRSLWDATTLAPSSSVTRSSHATTDVYELAPTSSPFAVAPAQGNAVTAPLSSAPAPEVVERLSNNPQPTLRGRGSSTAPVASPTPVQFSWASPASGERNAALSSLSPRATAVTAPLPHREPERPEASALQAAVPSEVAEAARLRRPLVIAVSLGAVVGVALGVVQGPLRWKSSADARAVSRAGAPLVRPVSAAAPLLAQASNAAPRASGVPAASPTPTTTPAAVASAPSLPVPGVSSPSVSSVPHVSAGAAGTPAATQSGGLGRPIPTLSIAKPALRSSSKLAPPVRHPKLIYGSDEVAE